MQPLLCSTLLFCSAAVALSGQARVDFSNAPWDPWPERYPSDRLIYLGSVAPQNAISDLRWTAALFENQAGTWTQLGAALRFYGATLEGILESDYSPRTLSVPPGQPTTLQIRVFDEHGIELPPVIPGANTFAYTMKVSIPPSPSDTVMANLRAFAVRRPECARCRVHFSNAPGEKWPEANPLDRRIYLGSVAPGHAIRDPAWTAALFESQGGHWTRLGEARPFLGPSAEGVFTPDMLPISKPAGQATTLQLRIYDASGTEVPPLIPGANTFHFTLGFVGDPSDTLMVNLRAFAVGPPDPAQTQIMFSNAPWEAWSDPNPTDRKIYLGPIAPDNAIRDARWTAVLHEERNGAWFQVGNPIPFFGPGAAGILAHDGTRRVLATPAGQTATLQIRVHDEFGIEMPVMPPGANIFQHTMSSLALPAESLPVNLRAFSVGYPGTLGRVEFSNAPWEAWPESPPRDRRIYLGSITPDHAIVDARWSAALFEQRGDTWTQLGAAQPFFGHSPGAEGLVEGVFVFDGADRIISKLIGQATTLQIRIYDERGVERLPVVPGANTFPFATATSAPPSPGDTLMVNMRAFAVTAEEDTTPPTVLCPDDFVVGFTSASGAVPTFSATAADEEDPGPTVVCVPASGVQFPIGVTQVTCAATDAAGNTATCMFQVTVLGARSTMAAGLADVMAVRASVTGKRERALLDETISLIRQSLAPKYWAGETHLDGRHGHHVFQALRHATTKLEALLDPRRDFSVDSRVLEWMACFTRAGRLLAEIAIADASAAGGPTRPVAQAKEQLALGDDNAAQGLFERALHHYRKAWEQF